MVYFIGEESYTEDDLEEMDDVDLEYLKLKAKKLYNDQKVIIGRGKSDYAKTGNGLSTTQYAEAKEKMNEAEALTTAIDLILAGE